MCPGKNTSPGKQSDEAVADLARYFERNGCVRRQNANRLAREGYQRYRKGDEVRLTANSSAELARIRKLLRQAGFPVRRPHVKGRRYRQPMYGREVVRRFLDLIGADRTADRAAAPNDELATPLGNSEGAARSRHRRAQR